MTFELLDRDGLGRLGRLSTPHGTIETPALLPVVHPDSTRQPVRLKGLFDRMGLGAVITSAYITWRNPDLRAAAEQRGIHGLLEFDGPIMTDSGAFQQHAYGHIEVTDDVILDFQERIGSDIATVLDVFVEPDVPAHVAEEGVRQTLERARRARERRAGLLAVPVQGGLDPGLRQQSARGASELGDVLAVGGVVPLMEQYRFPELVEVLQAARPALDPGRVVHLFGTGHPMTFAMAALFGVDLFDSSAYHKFARRESLLFPEGTVALSSLREDVCECRLCAATPLTHLGSLPPAEREAHIAEHNLLMSALEVRRVRQAIRDGMLWELVERRAHSHPALAAALDQVLRCPEVFLPTEPECRRTYRVTGPASLRRPAAVRFMAGALVRPRSSSRPLPGPKPALVPSVLAEIPSEDSDGKLIEWTTETALGPVPLELGEVYPVGALVSPSDFRPRVYAPRTPVTAGASQDGALRDWTNEWSIRHVRAILSYAWGADASRLLTSQGTRVERSRRSGRLRFISVGGERAFVVGNDGLPRPLWAGARRLHAAVPSPRARVGVRPDAVPFVREGRTLFATFAEPLDLDLSPGQSALLVDREDHLLAVGRMLLTPREFPRFSKGVVAWVTAHERSREPAGSAPKQEPAPD